MTCRRCLLHSWEYGFLAVVYQNALYLYFQSGAHLSNIGRQATLLINIASRQGDALHAVQKFPLDEMRLCDISFYSKKHDLGGFDQ